MDSQEKEGWSDSTINTHTLTIHYYKNGVSLCGRAKINTGNRYFDKSPKDIHDAYSHHCKLCIKKQINELDKRKR